MKTMYPPRRRRPTRVELAISIGLIGIISASFAVPKYREFSQQTRIAAVKGFAGSVKSAASLARGLSLATDNPHSVALEGAMVSLLNSYPDPSPSGIAAAVGSNDAGAAPEGFTFMPGRGTRAAARWTKDGAPTPAGCAVTYTAAPEGALPRVQTLTTGC